MFVFTFFPLKEKEVACGICLLGVTQFCCQKISPFCKYSLCVSIFGSFSIIGGYCGLFFVCLCCVDLICTGIGFLCSECYYMGRGSRWYRVMCWLWEALLKRKWMDLCGCITFRFWSGFSEMTGDGNPETTTTSIGLLHLIDVLGLSWFVSSTMLEPGIDWTLVLLFICFICFGQNGKGSKFFTFLKTVENLYCYKYFFTKNIKTKHGVQKIQPTCC